MSTENTYPIKWLKDKTTGTKFFPVTHIDAVRDEDNNSLETLLEEKQDELISGTNIKTINSQSILGSGNITIQGSGGGDTNVIETVKVNGTPLVPDANKAVDISAVTSLNGSTGAVTVTVPTKTSDLTNDSGFLTTETDPVFSASPAADITSSDISNWNGKQNAISDLETIRSGAALGATALQSYTETDPTVPSWAKASSKPSYTASEVGAVPTTRTVNGKALSADITLSASDVNALPSSTVIPDAQIQSDWNQTNTSAKDYIKNKPSIVGQVQADWNQTTTTEPDYIKNKPTIPTVPTISTDISADASSDTKTASPKAVKTYADSVAGDTNIIETVKVDGVALTPDSNKAVDIATLVPEVNHGTSDTTFTLTPNVMHIWGEVASLTISLPTDNNSVLDEFLIEFTSGSTPTSFNYPSTIKWTQPLVPEANKTYHVSIVNNLAGWLTDGMTPEETGDENVIEVVKVNNVALTPDANKAVNVSVPTKVSDLTNDSGFISSYTETDPVFTASAAHGISSSDITNWNGKQAALVSGTSIKTINNESLLGSGNISISEGENNIIESISVNTVAQTVTNKNVNITVPTKVSDLTNDSGFIDGMVILSYGSSTWSNFISAYNKNKVVYCRASSNANPATGTQSRLAFMAYVEGATTPTSVEFQYYRSVKDHSASQQGDQVFVYTLKNTGVWSVIVREASTKIVAGTGLSSSYSNDTLTITANSFTEADPVFSASAAAGITSSDITNWNSKTSNTGTITGVSVNGTSVATSDVANITSVPASILSGAIPSAVTATTQSSGDKSTKIATTAYVDNAIENLPEPMIFKGSLGTGGTITSLPAAAAANTGFTYKVITAGTYASQAAKVGDTFISDGSGWNLIPSGDEPSGTVTSIAISATSPIAIDSSDAITTSGTRTISHATSGVTAGTYRSVTVNATGHVTGGTNPTTLSGYGITDAKIANGVITLGSNSITPLTSFTESDPVFTASAASGITSSDISNWNSKTSNVGTITGITMNGASKGTSGVVDLGTVITAHQDISGKADKSEMGVFTSGDQTTITLKSGTSATVINAHQSLSSKQDTLVSGTNIKTVNGNSILGSGNLSTLAPIVNHGYTDTTFALTPNVFHIWEDVSSLTLTLSAPSDNTVMAEYAFQFESGTTATALSYPSTISWDDKVGELVPDSGKIYQVSIVNNIGLWVSINS